MWRAYLQLVRLPNVFTALADVLMGYLVTHGGPGPWPPLVLLLLSSGLIYSAGMALNDAYDVEQDRRERPHRPVPSGRVPLATAFRLGFGMLGAGVLCGWVAGLGERTAWPGIFAAAVALLAWGYDAVLKRTPLGPLAMGGCRTLNVLLGMSLAERWSPPLLLVAGALGLYVAGITWFARREAALSRRVQLAGATAVMALALGALAALPWVDAQASGPTIAVATNAAERFPLLIAVLALLILRRCFAALIDPAPPRVQAAVRQAIFSLVVLDAAVTLAACGPLWATAVAALLAPTLLLGRWLYST
jgi:4-hydroxybenzoate polyprenyltransferase